MKQISVESSFLSFLNKIQIEFCLEVMAERVKEQKLLLSVLLLGVVMLLLLLQMLLR